MGNAPGAIPPGLGVPDHGRRCPPSDWPGAVCSTRVVSGAHLLASGAAIGDAAPLLRGPDRPGGRPLGK